MSDFLLDVLSSLVGQILFCIGFGGVIGWFVRNLFTGRRIASLEEQVAELTANPEAEEEPKREETPTAENRKCPLTPIELVELANKRTISSSRDAIFEGFKGNWLELQGEVRDAENYSTRTVIHINLPGKIYASLWMKEGYNQRQFESLQKGESFEAKGNLYSVTENGIFLEECVTI